MSELEEGLVGLGLAPRSVRLYARTIAQAEAWMAERGDHLDTAGPSTVAAFAATKPHTHSSRRLIRAALAAYWRVTRRPDPPTAAIRVPTKRRMRCRALDPPAARRLEAAAVARGDELGLVVLLGLYLGLRREEIAELRWEDFDTDLEWVTVIGKGDVERTIPVHPVLLEHLRPRRRRTGWVFPGRYAGRPVHPATVWAWVREVSAGAGLEPVPPHLLRHTCLATMNDATGDLRAVQEFAGHAKPETTAGYTRATAKRLIQASLALEYGG